MLKLKLFITTLIVLIMLGCNVKPKDEKQLTAADILGNPEYLAISYGGYRKNTRNIQPTISELKEDMKLLFAMGVKILRTYNVQLQQAPNVLKAISELKKEDTNFEMFVMLGTWIDCENAWTDKEPNHNVEDADKNAAEISRAINLAKKYPDIVKVIAVGNEAMVKWATSYYVQPNVILKWVNHLQNLKAEGILPKDLWITSSDNFASWGGGSSEYHVEDLEKLIKAVDYISMHTYPMHDTHYNPVFWGVKEEDSKLSDLQKIDAIMLRAKEYAMAQYNSVFNYMISLGVNKPIHIGETGWASFSNQQYGAYGSKATDEYKEALYYKHMREWTNKLNISCFYFEAFNENWKDAQNPQGSENHFGLFTIDGKAKYALWNLVDKGIFKGLTRNGKPISKTYNGDKNLLMQDVLIPEKNQLIPH
ncbi:glycosyl hydrolase family 17 protein [Algibacter sp. PT7-4]|uniref:glycosyl hydrolase family 17 protein n=1 Tax=Algibacter ulvanivorans TaxID=3400999 RepID=UPI003AAD5F65